MDTITIAEMREMLDEAEAAGATMVLLNHGELMPDHVEVDDIEGVGYLSILG